MGSDIVLKGDRLKEARKKLGYTQDDLASKIGVSKSAISLYESEKRNPNLETLIEMTYVLGVSADYLLGFDVIVEVKDYPTPAFAALTQEELAFINEMKKDKFYYEMLFSDYKRGVEIIKQRL